MKEKIRNNFHKARLIMMHSVQKQLYTVDKVKGEKSYELEEVSFI